MANGTCAVLNCSGPVKSRGWCDKHYQRWRKYGDPNHAVRRKRPTFVPEPCAIDGCDQVTSLKSYGCMCEMHCARLRRNGTAEVSKFFPRKGQEPADVLLLRSEPHNDCILWTGKIRSDGYGVVNPVRWGTTMPHRYSYALAFGPILDGYEIDHLCHNADDSCEPSKCLHRRCINPDHLEAVPREENVRRQVERSRRSA